MFQPLFRVIIVCCLVAASDLCTSVCGQVVRYPGRATTGLPGQIPAQGIAVGAGGHGHRSGVNVVVPGPLPSAYLRRGGVQGYSGAQYSVPQVDAPSGMTVRTYSSAPRRTHYSVPPVYSYRVPSVYSDGRHHYDSNYSGIHQATPPVGNSSHSPYVHGQAGIESGLPIQYPPGVASEHSGVVPPVVVSPYGCPPNMVSPGSAPHTRLPSLPAPYPAGPTDSEYGMSVAPVRTVDQRPVVDEFAVGGVSEQHVGAEAVSIIQSLRSQISGDMSFRQQEYASAEKFYSAATETAPSRRAAWLRLAWAQLAQQRFSDAVVSLKTALHPGDDATMSWISGGLLYGDGIHTVAAVQNHFLWKWLQERPNSTDRLLLTAAFQQLLGNTGVAREMLVVSSQHGLADTLYAEMLQTFKDTHPYKDVWNLPAFAPPATTAVGNADNPDVSDQPADASGSGSRQPQVSPLTADIPEVPDADSAEKAADRLGVSVPAIPQAQESAQPGSEVAPPQLPDNLPQLPVPE